MQDGAAALAAFDQLGPSVVLLDVHLDGEDGVDLLVALREGESAGDTRFVAVTGVTKETEIDRVKASGFDELMSKPVPLELLKKKLSEWPNNKA